MLYPFQYIIDALFPPTDHELQLRPITKERFINFYRPNTHYSIVYLAPYTLPPLQAAIAACKFEHNYHAATLLASLVTAHLKTLPPKKTLLIPIPLSSIRERERGFNQVERVLSYVTATELPYNITISNNVLKRTLHTVAQTSLNRRERLKNLTGAFTCVNTNLHILHEYERIILCDDVLTTGSTLTTAKETLTRHLLTTTELYVLAWTH